MAYNDAYNDDKPAIASFFHAFPRLTDGVCMPNVSCDDPPDFVICSFLTSRCPFFRYFRIFFFGQSFFFINISIFRNADRMSLLRVLQLIA